MSVLITRFSALGDVAMAIPVVYSACRSNPEEEFVFVTKKVAARLFVQPPSNLRVVAVDTTRYKGVGGIRRLALELRRQYGVDRLADLHDVLRTRLLRFWLRLSGVRCAVIRKGKRGKRALTRRSRKVMMPLVSTRARYREVFHRLQLPYSDNFKDIFGGTQPDPAVYAAATPPRRAGERWIGIAPFAAHRGKIYPPELMEQVVARLSREPNVRLFLFGAGAEETNMLGRWAMKYDNVVNMAALALGFEAEMALMHSCETVVSMDSANMHLASLVGTRVVSVWGATHPYCGFMGWRQRKEDVVQLDMVCRPCSVFGNRPCRRGDFHCMYGISPDQITDRVLTG